MPDPRYDAVRAVVLAVMDDVEECPDGLYTARIMLFDDSGKPPKDAMNYVQASCACIGIVSLLHTCMLIICNISTNGVA